MLSDVDTLFGGTGNDDLIGGKGGNYLFAWSDTPFDTTGKFVGRDNLGNLMAYDSNGAPLNFFQDTGLNRALAPG